jgi:hypothetical protein
MVHKIKLFLLHIHSLLLLLPQVPIPLLHFIVLRLVQKEKKICFHPTHNQQLFIQHQLIKSIRIIIVIVQIHMIKKDPIKYKMLLNGTSFLCSIIIIVSNFLSIIKPSPILPPLNQKPIVVFFSHFRNSLKIGIHFVYP